MTCSCSSLRDTLERVKALLVCQETGKRATGYYDDVPTMRSAWCYCPCCEALRVLEAGMSEAGKGER
jgi:hypothetical protein